MILLPIFGMIAAGALLVMVAFAVFGNFGKIPAIASKVVIFALCGLWLTLLVLISRGLI